MLDEKGGGESEDAHLIRSDGRKVLLTQRLKSSGILSEVQLEPNQNKWNIGTVKFKLGMPLVSAPIKSISSNRSTFVCSALSFNLLMTFSLKKGEKRGICSTRILTFSYELGLTREKQTRKTSVWG